jgi:hypothetical protein
MNFFEQELRRLTKHCDGINNPTFAGRACYVDLGGDNRAKLEFVTGIVADRYEAVKATILNRSEGEVDTLRFRFEDIWGRKQVANPNFSKGIVPYIWTYDRANKGDSEWYVYKPTDADIKKLAVEVSGYLAVFTDRSLIPEKTQGRTGNKDSVIKTIRDSKQKPTPPKKASGKKKTETEL